MNKIDKLQQIKIEIEDLEIALEIESISSDIKDDRISELSCKVDRLSHDAAKSLTLYQEEKRKSRALERELELATELIHKMQLKIIMSN